MGEHTVERADSHIRVLYYSCKHSSAVHLPVPQSSGVLQDSCSSFSIRTFRADRLASDMALEMLGGEVRSMRCLAGGLAWALLPSLV
eukprot:5270936-Amphidinium_carterae.1